MMSTTLFLVLSTIKSHTYRKRPSETKSSSRTTSYEPAIRLKIIKSSLTRNISINGRKTTSFSGFFIHGLGNESLKNNHNFFLTSISVIDTVFHENYNCISIRDCEMKKYWKKVVFPKYLSKIESKIRSKIGFKVFVWFQVFERCFYFSVYVIVRSGSISSARGYLTWKNEKKKSCIRTSDNNWTPVVRRRNKKSWTWIRERRQLKTFFLSIIELEGGDKKKVRFVPLRLFYGRIIFSIYKLAAHKLALTGRMGNTSYDAPWFANSYGLHQQSEIDINKKKNCRAFYFVRQCRHPLTGSRARCCSSLRNFRSPIQQRTATAIIQWYPWRTNAYQPFLEPVKRTKNQQLLCTARRSEFHWKNNTIL